MQSAFTFFGGLADLFLSVMLWFIFDDGKTPAFDVDGERVYEVKNVIKTNDSAINIDCEDEEEQN